MRCGNTTQGQAVRGEVPTLDKELAITSAGTGEAGQGKEKTRTRRGVWLGVGGMQDRHAERPMG